MRYIKNIRLSFESMFSDSWRGFFFRQNHSGGALSVEISSSVEFHKNAVISMEYSLWSGKKKSYNPFRNDNITFCENLFLKKSFKWINFSTDKFVNSVTQRGLNCFNHLVFHLYKGLINLNKSYHEKLRFFLCASFWLPS